jgi:zinc transporter ZupT
MNAILFSIGTFFSTALGGLFALKFRDRLHLVLSFTAGVLLGVVSFDILPEIFDMSRQQGMNSTAAMIALVAGFVLFHSLEKLVLIHHEQEDRYSSHHHPEVGIISAFALAGHSFMDGVGIGLAFKVSEAIGVGVGIAVIAHDYCDGLNTVSLMLVNHNTTRRSFAMLILDAVAPILGTAFTFVIHISSFVLMLYLGMFAGFLLYIGVADVLPEAHSRSKPAETLGLIGLTCVGAITIFIVAHLLR